MMDTLIAVIVIIFSIGTAWGAHRLSGKYLSKQMDANRDELKADIAKHDKYHGQHFDSTRSLQVTVGTLNQRLTDHADEDDRRFDLIQKGIDTIQQDIKELLRRQP